MKDYVAGFLFSDLGTMVTLVEKKKFPPGQDWSKTPLNAVGGKLEEGETLPAAMAREFEEEAGVHTRWNDWDSFLELYTSRWRVTFYRCFSSQYMSQTRTMEEERILEISTLGPLSRVVPNLQWILPMALNKDVEHATVREKE